MSVPTIARIVIRQATLKRAEGSITQAIFEEQMQRIAREELAPKGVTLLIRDLPGGRTRFLFKENATGTVCEMMDFAADGRLENEEADLAEAESQQLVHFSTHLQQTAHPWQQDEHDHSRTSATG